MQVIIGHKDVERKQISLAYTPYHVWEHLFVRILETILFDCKVKVSGMTMLKRTVLIIEGDCDRHVEYILSQLKKKKIKKRWIDIERNIILNELPCMEILYDVKYYGKYNSYTYKQMLDFRKNVYDWDRVIIDNGRQDERRRQINLKANCQIFHEDAMDIMREQMIKKFLENNMAYNKISKKGFFLFCYPIEKCYGKENIKLFEKMLIESDKDFGYYQVKFKKRYPISIVVWPSLEKRESQIWLVIFTFLESKNVQFFGEENRQFIQNWIDSRIIGSYKMIDYYVYNT